MSIHDQTEKISDEKLEEILDEKVRLALDCIRVRQGQILSELHELGLPKDEIIEIIGSFRMKNEWPQRGLKKDEPLVLLGVAACLHVYELLSFTASQKDISERLAFKDCLADLGSILMLLGNVAIRGEGESARKEFQEKLQMMAEKIAETENRVKRKVTEKARETKRQRADAHREAVINFYKEMKRKNPKTTKDEAAIKFYNGGQGKKFNLSFSTIRGYLKKI